MRTVRVIPNTNSSVIARKPSGKPRIDRFPDRQTENAVSTELIPSVAMNESILTLTINVALMTPTISPSMRDAVIAAKIDQCLSTSNHETVTAEADTVEAIERSNTPEHNGTSRPRATTMRMDCWLITERWVSQVSHVDGTHSENSTQATPYR